jgi:single-strand DNA-binding protein
MSFQQVIVNGYLSRDPEMKYTPSGSPVTKFSIPVSRSWTDQSGQKQERTVWFNVTAWAKLAEFASQYLVKGQSVIVVGELEEPRVWQDQQGNHRASLDLRAQTIRFSGPRPDGSSAVGSMGDYNEGGQAGGEEFGGGNGARRSSSGSPAPARGGSAGRGSEHTEPDDIPF